MALRKAVIDESGLCHNVVMVADDWRADDPGQWQPPPGYSLVDAGERGQIGAVFDDKTGLFVDPEDTPPPEKTDIEREVAALKKGFQALVDEKVIGKDKLPQELDVTAAQIEVAP